MKQFDRVEISANDDGTMTIEFYPYSKTVKSKGDEPMMTSSYDKRKTMSADDLDSAIKKIKSMINGKSPEKDMNRFFNGESEE